MPHIPRAPRVLAGVVGGVVFLSACAAAVLALMNEPRPAWLMLGFELVIIAACALALPVVTGRRSEGPALALLCVAGTIAVGSFLGYLGAGRALAGLELTPVLIAREIAAALIAGAAGVIVLDRDRARAWPALAKGAVIGAAAVGTGAALWFGLQRAAALPGVATFLLGAIGFVVVTVLVSASVHLMVRAFEFGRIAHGNPAPRG